MRSITSLKDYYDYDYDYDTIVPNPPIQIERAMTYIKETKETEQDVDSLEDVAV